ncbi:MAG: hypothetical protein K2I87_06340, partial [Bacteroidales bacterium]|nr:hypothetical protein [Bacteroidales bacterium]
AYRRRGIRKNSPTIHQSRMTAPHKSHNPQWFVPSINANAPVNTISNVTQRMLFVPSLCK